VALPDAEDRFITKELEDRRDFPVLQVIEVIRAMSQLDLLETEEVETVFPSATLSEESGLKEVGASTEEDFVSVSPMAAAQ
jgi:hypothetical protein